MKTVSKFALLVAAGATFAACGDDDPPPPIGADTGADVGTDTDSDTTPDVDPDTAPDADPDVDPDTVDPCDGLDLCAEEGSSCDGDSVVVCEENSDGCLVETVTECGDDQICDDSGEEAICADDICAGLELCDEAGSFCDEGSAVDCTANEDGCIVRTETACADGTECNDEGEVAECLPTCEDTCDTEGTACNGDVLEVCELGESGCLELVANDCAALVDGGTCDAEALLCTTPGDPCDGVDPADLCDPADVGVGFCDADTFNLCTTNVFGCALLEGTDCAAAEGGFCTVDGCDAVEAGACDDIDPADLCEEEGVLSCSEDNVLECQRNEDGCLVIVDLGACEEGDSCIDGVCVGPCDDVEVCDAALACDGDELVTCEEVEGCLVETGRETCDAGCDDTGDAPECTPIDPCVDLACDPIFDAPLCDGDLLLFCEDDAELGCAYYRATDCTEEDPAFTCVDDGFGVFCEEDPCGDGIFDGFVGEECDDGNTDDGDGCSSICTLEDGFECTIVEGTSVCVAVVCGDGVLASGEECDDGNTDDEDGCSSTCTVEEGYECVGEPSECVVPVCGDGVLTSGESCDDGNTDDGDGCSADCGIELDPTVGATATIEATIDGSEAQYDRVSAGCTGEGDADHFFDAFTLINPTGAAIEIAIQASWAGDGYIHVFSSDFDPAAPLDSCITGDDDFEGTRGSLIESVTVDAGTAVVLVASTFSPAAIVGDYTLTMTTLGCGDGFISEGEECDDGNVDAADGCSATCTVEEGYSCEDEPSDCSMADICGNGRIEEGEECDDGNVDAADGCSAMCSVEGGFLCGGEPSVCTALVCGDAAIGYGEACDDGNTDDGDGCSASCAVEIEDGTEATIENSIDESDPTFIRASGSCGDSLGREVYHDVLPIVNVSEGDLTVTVTAAWSGDGFLHAYFGFDPEDSLAGCEAANDDFGGLGGSQVIFTVPALSSAELVASSFGSLVAHGAYTITVEAEAAVVEP